MLLVILMVKELLKHVYEKEFQKTNQKGRNYMSNGKAMIIHLIVGFIKKILYKMSQYFPKPYEPLGGDINVKVDLSNYASKLDLKNAKGVDTSKLAADSDLASLKVKVNKIDIGKLKTVPIDLSKISNVVKNEVVKETVYDKLVIIANSK